MANIYTNAFFDLTTTDKIDIYTCPAGSRVIIQNIQLTCESGTTQVQVYIYDNSAATEYEISHVSVGANTTVNLAKGPIVLEENDVLRIEANSANVVSGTVSILEINRSDENG